MSSLTHSPVPGVELPPKLAPTQRIIEARGESNCVCGRPAISCGYCSAECLEREEAKAERKAKPDGSLASPTPNRRTLYALGTNIDGEAKLLNVQLHGPDSFIVWTHREAAEDYLRRYGQGKDYAVVEVL